MIMAPLDVFDPLYKEFKCDEFKWPPLKHVDEEFKATIAQNYGVLPLYELKCYEQRNVDSFSFKKNELLKCRWGLYQDNTFSKNKKAFKIADSRDYHFYNAEVKLLPSESVFRRQDFRYKLNTSYGIDSKGHMPLPYDMSLKFRHEPKSKRMTDGGKKKEEENKISVTEKVDNGKEEINKETDSNRSSESEKIIL